MPERQTNGQKDKQTRSTEGQPGKICTWGGRQSQFQDNLSNGCISLVAVSFLLGGELVEEGWGEPRWALGRLMGISCSTGQLEREININGNGSRVEYKCNRSYD